MTDMTRKAFLDLAGRGAVGAATLSSFDFVGRLEAKEAADVLGSAEVRKVREHIAANKDVHIGKVQRDLRQPSVSSWNKGCLEMADLMVESFKKIG